MKKLKRVIHNCLGLLPTREVFLEDWEAMLLHPNITYAKFDFAFNGLPELIRRHRLYFSQNKRGFGEEAFHAMWYYLSERYSLGNFLEIGVYRGQTVSLVALIQMISGKEQKVTGISPLKNIGDSLSNYVDIDYRSDILSNFKFFNLNPPRIVEAYSTDPAAKETIESQYWDCIYIDGSHDYEIVKQDWAVCSRAIRSGGLIVLDDAGLYTRFKALKYGFKGHPGPSRVAEEVCTSEFQKILQVGHNVVFRKR